MLETDKFSGLNIESYLDRDVKELGVAIKLFIIFKTLIFIVIVHSTQKQLKMTNKTGPGGLRQPV